MNFWIFLDKASCDSGHAHTYTVFCRTRIATIWKMRSWINTFYSICDVLYRLQVGSSVEYFTTSRGVTTTAAFFRFALIMEVEILINNPYTTRNRNFYACVTVTDATDRLDNRYVAVERLSVRVIYVTKLVD